VTTAITALDAIVQRYRALAGPLTDAHASAELLRAFRLTDESISILIEDLLLRVHQLAHAWLSPPLLMTWQATAGRARARRDRLSHGAGLSLPCCKRRRARATCAACRRSRSSPPACSGWRPARAARGRRWEQVLFAGAAGVSMIFATLVAFYAQAAYGEFTLPVFVALVVGYMFKDRIKESGRTFSSRLLNRHLYDYRTEIETQDGRRQLGNVREKATYLPMSNVPAAVMAARGAGPAR
jgi:hypothetical protein